VSVWAARIKGTSVRDVFECVADVSGFGYEDAKFALMESLACDPSKSHQVWAVLNLVNGQRENCCVFGGPASRPLAPADIELVESSFVAVLRKRLGMVAR